MHRFFFCAALVAGIGLPALFADPPTSGPTVGKTLGGFSVVPLNGPSANKKTDLFSKTGDHPTAILFLRSVNDATAELVRQIAAATEKHRDSKLTCLVILCSDSKDVDAKFSALANEKLPGTQFAVSADKAAGPKGYQLGADAEVTVVLAHKRQAKAVFAYRAGELKNAQPIVAEASRVARAVFAPNIGDPIVAYTPKKSLNAGGARKCETC